jgi:DNA mismatch endonuclease (patch repair protein)
MPATRTDFWSAKIAGNRRRDEVDRQRLQDLGWKTLCVWECALRGPSRLSEAELADCLTDFLASNLSDQNLSGVSRQPADDAGSKRHEP